VNPPTLPTIPSVAAETGFAEQLEVCPIVLGQPGLCRDENGWSKRLSMVAVEWMSGVVEYKPLLRTSHVSSDVTSVLQLYTKNSTGEHSALAKQK
jgi:hypothetical protein